MFGSEAKVKHGGRRMLRCLTGLGLAMLTAGAAAAQQHPDLSGYWELHYDSFNVPQASVAPGTLAGAAAQIRHDIEAVRWCDPIGMPAITGDRAPIDLRQSASVIGIVAKPQSSERYIFIDGRKHLEKDETGADNERSFHRAVGRRGARGGYGRIQRPRHNALARRRRADPNSHLIERYRLMGNGQRLDVTFTWEDANVFSKPHTYELRYYRIPEISDPRIFQCNAKDPERASIAATFARVVLRIPTSAPRRSRAPSLSSTG